MSDRAATSRAATRLADTEGAGSEQGLSGAMSTGGPRQWARLRRLLPWMLAALTLGLASTLPLAPVVVDTPEVRWPLDPTDPEPTVALFMPYRPIDIEVTLPCPTIRALATRHQGSNPAVLLGTALPDSGRGRDRSLFVTVTTDAVRITSSGQELWTGPPPAAPDCDVIVRADQSGSGVVVLTDAGPDTILADAPGIPVPEVVAFTTDVVSTDGLSPTVLAHPDARFQSSPTAVKTALAIAHVLALVGCLWLLRSAGRAPLQRRRDRPADDAPRLPGRAPGGRPRLVVGGLADAAVVLTLTGWTAIGPIQTDDFYYSLEARTVDVAGFVGNQVRYFNVPEVPFVLVQTLLAPLADVSASPFVLRLPSLIAGLVVWWLLTRQLVPLLVERPHPALRLVAGIVLLAWWLPWNTTVRPEPFVTLAWTVTLVLALQAIRRRQVWLVGTAAVVAGLAVTITASGLACTTTLVILLPRLWPVFAASRLGAWASLALTVACGSVASTVVFTDSTLASTLAALHVHQVVGPETPWWAESIRYWYLMLGPDPNQRHFARQVVVLTTLVVVVGVSIALLRVTRQSADRTSWAVPALAYLAANAALIPTPTKWSHHLGALAAPGTLALTVAVAVLLRRRPDRWASAALLGTLALTAGVAFHGGNDLVEYSAYGVQPVLPTVLGNPLLWALLGMGTAVAATLGHRRRTSPRPSSWRWPEGIVGTVVAALVTALLVQIGSAALATWRLRDTWSMGRDTVDTLAGRPACGFADWAVALTDPHPLDPLDPLGLAPTTASGELPEELDDYPPATLVPAGIAMWSTWRSEPPSEAVVVETPWLQVTDLAPRDALAVFVTGNTGSGTEVVAEFATQGPAGDAVPVGSRPIDVQAPGGGDPVWQQVILGPSPVLPAGTSLVRLRLTDRNDAEERWVMATDVHRLAGRTLSEVLPDDEPVLVDWPLGFNMPCQEPPRVVDGMVEPVEWLVQSATFAQTPPLTVIDGGGSYSTAPTVSEQTTYPGFVPGVFPYAVWGNLVHWEPRLATGAYRLIPGTRVVDGWRWWPGAGPGPSPD